MIDFNNKGLIKFELTGGVNIKALCQNISEYIL